MRNCVTVALQTLTLFVWVRILVPQPKAKGHSHRVPFCFYLRNRIRTLAIGEGRIPRSGIWRLRGNTKRLVLHLALLAYLLHASHILRSARPSIDGLFSLAAELRILTQLLAIGKNWVRIPRPKFGKLAWQAKVAGIFAIGEYPALKTYRIAVSGACVGIPNDLYCISRSSHICCTLAISCVPQDHRLMVCFLSGFMILPQFRP